MQSDASSYSTLGCNIDVDRDFLSINAEGVSKQKFNMIRYTLFQALLVKRAVLAVLDDVFSVNLIVLSCDTVLDVCTRTSYKKTKLVGLLGYYRLPVVYYGTRVKWLP